MHVRSARLVLVPLLTLAAHPALAQNLLVNPGFDRDLGGWTVTTVISPNPPPFPDYAQASAAWTASDASGSVASGGLALHAKAFTGSWATAAATQCVAITAGTLATVGARILTTRQFTTSSASVAVSFFPSADCSGTPLARASTNSLPFVVPETSSGGVWLPTTTQALASASSRSALAEVSVRATGTFAYGLSEVEAVADDAFLTLTSAATTTWILPSAAWVHGAAGSYWATVFTLCNPGSTDAAVALKWLGHDADGRAGYEFTYLVRAGQTLVPDEETWQINHREDWGAILVTSSSPALVVQSETRTNVPGGGAVGQALPALGPADFARATPKTLAPVRENASFRTNLVLANATEAPVTARVVLYAADGTLIGSRDVDLPPLGMTQINHVASAFGAGRLDAGRIAVSTPTPGGLVAAYASVIDNTTNDPRTILPQDVAGGPSAANLLVNPGFDRDLSGWDLRTEFYPPGYVGASAQWVAMDVLSGNSGSVRFQLEGYRQTVNRVLLSQCVAAVPGRRYTGGGLVRTDSQLQYGVIARLELYTSAGCAGEPVAAGPPDGYSLWPMSHTANDSDGRWLLGFASAVAGAGVQSLRFSAGIDAVTASYYSFSSFDGLFDDAFLVEQTDPAAAWILPSSAKVSGAAGSSWTTTLTLANAGADDALVTLRFLGHDGDGRSGDEKLLPVRAGTVVDLPDILGTLFGRIQDFGAIRITTSSASVAVQSETSTPSSGGTVGQALPTFGPADFAGVTPKTLAPIQENAFFRTNLVLANTVEIPVTAHVALFDVDGTLLGSRDVDLPPLGMTQLSRVAITLGVSTVNLGRLSVSTPTPGGLVAAYASIIDNRTNDPRTILPR